MITFWQTRILDYLSVRGWISPTELGMKVAGKVYNCASGWASPKCKALVRSGHVTRNKRGQYKLKKYEWGEYETRM